MKEKNTAKKLLVINQYYAPDIASTGPLITEWCQDLVKRGFEVHVVTGQPSHSATSPEAPAFEVMEGVHVHRVSLGRTRGRERMRTRLIGYARFMWGAWRKARAVVKESHPDCIVTFSNPPSVGLIGARLATKYRLPYTYVLYDIHPDALLATSWIRMPWPVVPIWNAMNGWVLRRAHTVVVPGEGMRTNLVQNKGVPPDKVRVIPNWGRPEMEPGLRSQPIRLELGIGDEELLLLYAGNMGIMHPLESILDAADRLRDQPVRFVLVGDGVKRAPLVSRVEAEGLDQVTFLPFQSEVRLGQLLAGSDACFVALQPGLEGVAVPSKAYTYLSAARPLITIMSPEADIALLATETGCGWNVESGEELADLVRKLVNNRAELETRGKRARVVYDEQFRQQQVVGRYAVLLEEVATSAGNAG